MFMKLKTHYINLQNKLFISKENKPLLNVQGQISSILIVLHPNHSDLLKINITLLLHQTGKIVYF